MAFLVLSGRSWHAAADSIPCRDCILLVAGYACAAWQGRLTGEAALAGVLLMGAVLAVRNQGARVLHLAGARALRLAGHGVLIVMAIAMGMHLLPGFHNLQVANGVLLSSTSVPYSMYLNLDKPLAAFCVLLAVPWVIGTNGANLGRVDRFSAACINGFSPFRSLAVGLAFGAATASLCMVLASGAGLLAWEPKWPRFTLLWALNNFLLVSFAEEILFRGYLQQGMVRLLGTQRHAESIALITAAVLFGLVHWQGGATLVAMATVAGIGYGLAFRRGGLVSAMTAHFIVNFVHFLLFSYPLRALM